MIRLYAFLGNFGKEYEKSRHNVAWQFADSLSFLSCLNWQKKFKGQFASQVINENQIYFLKPETYMNLSGESIGDALRFYKIKPEEILVIHDELELSCGIISLKWSGGLGGHNGLRSIKATLGTADFWRLRFGIGRPSHDDVSGYVLGNFSKDENIVLSQSFLKTAELIDLLMIKEPNELLKDWKKVVNND
ncbi:MAG: aminoacyl-tRNA hydrolase [Treponema sp.]|nr:aminoacyl-tRNA hydrolase [Treponema sp.]